MGTVARAERAGYSALGMLVFPREAWWEARPSAPESRAIGQRGGGRRVGLHSCGAFIIGTW